MKVQMLVAVLAACLMSAALAEEKESMRSVLQAAGQVEVKGSRKGRIAFVNLQNRLPAADIAAAAANVAKETMCQVDVGAADGAQVVVEVVDNETDAALTAYPEEFRARVNIARLSAGLKGSAVEKFFASRCRKELLRAFCYACGVAGSQYPRNTMAITRISDLDLVGEFIPGDTVGMCTDRLNGIGVTPARYVGYARACIDGWAPAPTNEAQKIVWEKAREMKERGPSNPIKIRPPAK